MVTKIAVTDDHEMILQGIVMMLENTADIDVVGRWKGKLNSAIERNLRPEKS